MPINADDDQEAQFYSSRQIRQMFGTPGYPISKTTLKKLRDEGIGPLPGNHVKTKFPCHRRSRTRYIYPRAEIDDLLYRLTEWAKKKT